MPTEVQPRTVLMTTSLTTLQKPDITLVIAILSKEDMSEYDLIPILANSYNSARCRYKVMIVTFVSCFKCKILFNRLIDTECQYVYLNMLQAL